MSNNKTQFTPSPHPSLFLQKTKPFSSEQNYRFKFGATVHTTLVETKKGRNGFLMGIVSQVEAENFPLRPFVHDVVITAISQLLGKRNAVATNKLAGSCECAVVVTYLSFHSC